MHFSAKGGLAPDLARRLHSFLEVSANVPALPARSWNSSEAAAEELFRLVLAQHSCWSSLVTLAYHTRGEQVSTGGLPMHRQLGTNGFEHFDHTGMPY